MLYNVASTENAFSPQTSVAADPKVDPLMAMATPLPRQGSAEEGKGAGEGKVVRRRTAAKAVLARRSTCDPSSPTTPVPPPDQRVHLHNFSKTLGSILSPKLPTRRNTMTVSELPKLRSSCQDACCALGFSPDGEHLAGGFFDGYVRLFDSQFGVEDFSVAIPRVASFSKDSSPSVTNMCWMPGGASQILATTDAAGTACLWQKTDEVCASGLKSALECVLQTEGGMTLSACCFTQDSKRLAVAGADKVIKVYDVEEGVPATVLKLLKQDMGGGLMVPGRIGGHSLKIVCLKADPTNAAVIYSAGIDRKILRFDLRVGFDAVGQIHGPQLQGDAMCVSNDGRSLLTGSHRVDKPLQVFDLRQLSKKYSTLTEACTTYSWNADETGKPSSTLLFGVSWDSDKNKIIATAGQHENTAKCFKRQDPEPLHTVGKIETAQCGFWSAAVAPDASRVAFGSVDGSVHLAKLPSAVGYAAD